MSTSSRRVINKLSFDIGPNYTECTLDDVCLTPGVYAFRVAFLDNNRRIMWYGENLLTFQINPGTIDMSSIPALGIIDVPFKWDFKKTNENTK